MGAILKCDAGLPCHVDVAAVKERFYMRQAAKSYAPPPREQIVRICKLPIFSTATTPHIMLIMFRTQSLVHL